MVRAVSGGWIFWEPPVPRDRWFVEGIWREQHGPWQLAGAATLMRDSEMMREFPPGRL